MNAEENLTLQSIKVTGGHGWDIGEKDRLCFLFIKKGRGTFSVKDTTQALVPGDFAVLNNGDGWAGKLFAEGTREIALNYFSARYEHLVFLFNFNEICLLERIAKRVNGLIYPASSSLARECQALVDAAPAPNTFEHRCHLLKIVGAVLTEECRKAESKDLIVLQSSKTIESMLKGLSLQQLQDLSVTNLARELGYSRRHLNRLFHKHLGTSVSALKMEARLMKAAALLQDPAAKVITVAMECGFNHLGLFSSRFRDRFGVNPSQWRKQLVSPLQDKAAAFQGAESCQLRACGLCIWSSCPELNAMAHQTTAAKPKKKVARSSGLRVER
jgi:AraC-like DNA-binding protein